MPPTTRPRPAAGGKTALTTLAATGLQSMSDAIVSVLASQSLPATPERPYLRAYSFVRHGRVPVTATGGRRVHLPARHVTLLRAEYGGAFYARVIVPEWGEDRLYGPCDDRNDVAAVLDRDHVEDLRRARSGAPEPSDA